jgi:energy-coupling factor transporter ATP-binding protein EcfA2
LTSLQKPPGAFYSWLYDKYGVDADKLDPDAEYDASITLEENKTEFLEKFPVMGAWRDAAKHKPERADLLQLERSVAAAQTSAADAPFPAMLRGAKVICVLANTGSGKTALSHRVADALHEATGRRVFVYRHPTPQILPTHYDVLYRFGDIEHLRDAILLLDEPQLTIPIQDKQQNTAMLKLFSLCRQRNITVILTTSDTRYVTRGMEAYVDEWLLKDLEPSMVKQGSMAKKIIKDNVLLSVDGYVCGVDEFVRYNRKTPQFNGRHKFALPSYWTKNHSTPFHA